MPRKRLSESEQSRRLTHRFADLRARYNRSSERTRRRWLASAKRRTAWRKMRLTRGRGPAGRRLARKLLRQAPLESL